MRWDELFDDLEAQVAAARDVELSDEVRDRARVEVARIRLTDRLRPAVGHVVDMRLRGAGAVRGRLEAVGPDWALLTELLGRECLVALESVVTIGELGAQSAAAERASVVASRLDLRFALRGLARDRAPVDVVAVDGSVIAGTIDRVGADFVEVAEHPAGEPRRADAVRGVRLVRLGAVAAVRAWRDAG